MNNVKRTLFIFAIMLTIIMSSAFLFSCGKSESVKVSVFGNGHVSTISTNGNKYYLATAEQWHSFVGWFDGNRKYSDNEKLKLTKKTPRNLEARFVTTARLSFDRFFNGLYNSYKKAMDQEGAFFNILANAKFSFSNIDNEINQNYILGGHLNFNGLGNQLFLKSDSENEKYAIVYDESSENGYGYIFKNEEKYSFKGLGIISKIINNLPAPSKESWSVENILNNKTSFYQFEQYFGYNNAMGIVESVTNDKNSSTFLLSFNKLLSLLKTNYPNFEDGSFIKELTDILVGNYFDATFPKISISAKINYNDDINQHIEDMTFEFDISKDYLLKFDEENITIPKGKIKINVDCLQFESNDVPFAYDEDLNSFPKPDINMLNLHLEGNLSFLMGDKGDEKAQDVYKVELNADINPFAMLSLKNGDDYENIQWNKLGFLSFKIVLIPAENESDSIAQYERHKGATEYLNLLIDTDKFGENLLFYASFYDPNTLLSTSYFFNNSFNLKELYSFYREDNLSKVHNNQTDKTMFVSKIFNTLMDICLNFDINDINCSFYKFFLKYFDKSGFINENLSLKENGLLLNTNNIREIIRNKENEIGLTFLGYPIKSDSYLFGEDDITSLLLNFDKSSVGTVRRNNDGYYVDSLGNSIVDDYNKNHNTVIKVNKISSLDDKIISFEEIHSLNGEIVQADELCFSDGKVGQTYYNSGAKEEKMNLKILKTKVLSIEGNIIKIRFVLSVDSPLNAPNYLDTTLSEVLLNHLNIPYGMLIYESEIKIKS